MTRCHTPLAALLGTMLALAPLPAQCEFGVSFTLLLQVPPGDIILNKPLVDALLGEPELDMALETAFGDAYDNILQANAELPAPHAAGTFQVHVGLALVGKSPFGDAERARATDTVVAHLRSRLDAMLVEEPSRRLQERRALLGDRLQVLQREQAELHEANTSSRTLLADRDRRTQRVTEQLAEARIELTTAESTQQRLDRMQKEHSRQRDEMRRERDGFVVELDRAKQQLAALEATLADLQRGIHGKREEVEARKAEIATATVRLLSLASAIEALNQRDADAVRILTAVLEQVPTQALAVQRAESRLAALKQELGSLPMDEVVAAARKRLTEGEGSLERLQIDLSVTKTLLTEVEGQLARIQPLQCRLLRARG